MKLFITPGGHKLTNKKFTIKIRTGDTLSRVWADSFPLSTAFSCLVYGYRSCSRSIYATIVRARVSVGAGRLSIVCMHNLSLYSSEWRNQLNGNTSCDKSVSGSTRNRLASTSAVLVILKLEINDHLIIAYTVECSSRHTACSQIKLNETNNLACVPNRQSEHRDPDRTQWKE